jgi:hypothetical protein
MASYRYEQGVSSPEFIAHLAERFRQLAEAFEAEATGNEETENGTDTIIPPAERSDRDADDDDDECGSIPGDAEFAAILEC